MEFEKYTERVKGFLQSAQTLALRSNHQQLAPEHVLKVLLEDKEGLAANLIRAAGGDPAKALNGVEAELAKLPKVEGGVGPGLSGAGDGQAVRPGREDRREGGRFLRHRGAAAAGPRAGRAPPRRAARWPTPVSPPRG